MAASATPWVIDVDEESFEDKVLTESMARPVVVDFWAPWCGPCRQLGPLLEKLTNEHQGKVLLAKIDVDQCQNLAAHFQIESIPAVKAFKDGQLVLQFNGVLPEKNLRDFFARLVPEAADQTLIKAHALEEGRPAEAEALYRKYLEKDATDEEARLGLARVLLAQKKDEEVTQLLESVDTDGPHAAEAQRLKGMLAVRGLSTGGGGDEAALRQRVAADAKDAAARYELGCLLAQRGAHEESLQLLLAAGELDMKLAMSKVREAMVQIFYALGPSHPLSDKYRSQLARLLY